MNLKFKNQPFQQMAVDAFANLFLGQERQQSTFQIDIGVKQGTFFNDYGVGNALLIDDERTIANMRQVQKRNNLQQSVSGRVLVLLALFTTQIQLTTLNLYSHMLRKSDQIAADSLEKRIMQSRDIPPPNEES